MGIFKNLFSKKRSVPTDELEVAVTTQSGSIGEAEHIANVVTAGLEKENYSSMNSQLSSLSQRNEEKETYVFEHPGIITRYCAVAIISVLSVFLLYCLLIGVGTIYFSSKHFIVGLVFTVLSSIFLVVNIVMLIKLISTIKFKSRFDMYEELIGYKSIEFIGELAICAKKKESLVIKDLKRAVEKKLIPQGHFSNGNLVFMVSDSVNNRYLEKPAVYDRYFEKIIEERKRIKSRTPEIQQIIETGEQYIEKIRGYQTLIKDKNISKKISRIESIVSMIFYEIDANPTQTQTLGVFLNYYLPTTEKLLNEYVNITESKDTQIKNSKSKKEIEKTFNIIILAYEGVLEKMYEEYEMDITSDIDAMELSMKQEGLIS